MKPRPVRRELALPELGEPVFFRQPTVPEMTEAGKYLPDGAAMLAVLVVRCLERAHGSPVFQDVSGGDVFTPQSIVTLMNTVLELGVETPPSVQSIRN